MGVPPGSAVSRTSRPASRSLLASRRNWVDLPLPSGPSKVIKTPRRLVINEVKGLLQVLPGFALGILVVGPQKVGRMEGDNQRNIAPFVPAAAQTSDAVLGGEQRLGRRRAQRADRLRLNRHQLPEQKLAANLH